jgi:hypothetical protein
MPPWPHKMGNGMASNSHTGSSPMILIGEPDDFNRKTSEFDKQ